MDHVRQYYAGLGKREWTRLDTPSGALEFDVNSLLIQRHLTSPSRILDIGGGPGRYALWLAELGHEVTLADLSPPLLEDARERVASSEFRERIREIVEADARDLSRWNDDEFDVALCLGPFYHLPDEKDRDGAARELWRVVRPGGHVFVAFMPWQAFFRRTAAVPQERHRLHQQDWLRGLLERGEFHNDVPGRFDHGYGARPDEIIPFFEDRHFESLGLFASEGLGAGIEEALAEIRESSPQEYADVLDRIVESADDPNLFGLTTHLLYIGRVRGSQ